LILGIPVLTPLGDGMMIARNLPADRRPPRFNLQ
jgi:hypothetical protein